MNLSVTHHTAVGNVRKNNEDSLGIDERSRFFAVADGIGGGPFGEVASRTAILSAMKAAATDPFNPQLRTTLAFRAATAAMHHQHATKHRGMGTTLVTLAFDPILNTAVIGNAGDSRCYLLRSKKLTLLTQDQIKDGLLWGGITTYTLPQPKIDMIRVAQSDVFLLCSDGVNGELDDTQIAALMASRGSGKDTATRIVVAATFDPGLGRDNATAILIRVKPR